MSRKLYNSNKALAADFYTNQLIGFNVYKNFYKKNSKYT